jgi:hypothetical protein
MGRKRILPDGAVQFTVHAAPADAELLEKIRTVTGGDRDTAKAAVLREALHIGLHFLAKELDVGE